MGLICHTLVLAFISWSLYELSSAATLDKMVWIILTHKTFFCNPYRQLCAREHAKFQCKQSYFHIIAPPFFRLQWLNSSEAFPRLRYALAYSVTLRWLWGHHVTMIHCDRKSNNFLWRYHGSFEGGPIQFYVLSKLLHIVARASS